MKPAAVLAHLRHIAALGLPPSQSIPEMLDLTLALVPGELASAFAFDARLVPRAVHAPRVVGMPGEMVKFDWAALDPAGEPTPEKLVAIGKTVNNLDVLGRQMSIERSAVYNEVSRPMGLAPAGIDLVVRDRLGRPLGIVYVMRKIGARYTASDELALMRLHDYFALAFAAPESAAGGELSSVGHDPAAELAGTLLVDKSGRVIAGGRDALVLAIELAETIGSGESAGIGKPLPSPLDRLHAARAAGRENSDFPANASWILPKGRYHARAERLAGGWDAHSFGGPRLTALTLSRHPSFEVALLRRVARLELSPAQRRIAYHIGRGDTNERIAAQLGITAETLRGYLKAIYTQLGCEGRTGLAMRLCIDTGPGAAQLSASSSALRITS